MALGLLVRAPGLLGGAVGGNEGQHGELESSLGTACGCLERELQDQGTPGKKSTDASLIRSAACCVTLLHANTAHAHCKLLVTQRHRFSKATDK